MSKTVQRSNMTMTDAKGKVLRAPPEDNLTQTADFKWWNADDKDMAASITGTIQFMRQHQGARLEQLITSTRLYGENGSYNLLGTAFTKAQSVSSNPSSQQVSYNLCSSIIDTLESKMAKNKVVPTYITNGGMWDVQKKAMQLTKFTQGLFYQEQVHFKTIDAFSDAAVWGDGFVKVFENNDRVCIQRALPHDLLVDMIETINHPPSQLHQVQIMDRDCALELLPELEEYIVRVAPATCQEIGAIGTAADLIVVCESWKLGPNGKGGVRAFTVGDGCLAEDYNKDYFPFPHLRYAKRKLGWYGLGACERLQNLQGELNRNLRLKQRALWMQSAFKILIENGSKIVSQHLSNEIGSLVFYSGTQPTYVTPPATNPELQQWIDAVISYAYRQEGMSQLSASGQIPQGVESGKAMRTYTQVTDDRFLYLAQNIEQFSLEIGRQAVEVAKDIYARKGSYEVIFPDKTFMETVNWKDIQLDKEQYVLKAFPTSSLSEDLTGRLSEVQELAKGGMISPRTARRMLDMPDLEVNSALANAAEDRLHQIFEDMLHDGEMVNFEPGFHDAELGKQLGLEYINYAQYHKCPDDRIQLVRDYIGQINAPIIDLQNQADTAQMGGQGMPAANPTPTPTSNLIPNVNTEVPLV